MSAVPLVVEGARLTALVVGGGVVATRKALALLESGARVRVVAPEVSDALVEAASNERLQILRERYTPAHLGDALLVVAATNDAATNATIAADAAGRLINVVTAPALGNCITPAIHRRGEIVVAVSAGGVPAAAARIRDRIAAVVDERYAAAVGALASLRRGLLDAGDQSGWSEASAALIGSDFCDEVESGVIEARVSRWR